MVRPPLNEETAASMYMQLGWDDIARLFPDCFKMLVMKWLIPNLLTDQLSYYEVLLSTTVRRHLMWILNRDKGRNGPRRKSCQFCPKLGSFQYPVQGSLEPPTAFSGIRTISTQNNTAVVSEDAHHIRDINTLINMFSIASRWYESHWLTS